MGDTNASLLRSYGPAFGRLACLNCATQALARCTARVGNKERALHCMRHVEAKCPLWLHSPCERVESRELECDVRCAQRMSVAGMGGMVWDLVDQRRKLENWNQTCVEEDLARHPLFREVECAGATGCIPDAVVPTTDFYLLSARWPDTREQGCIGARSWQEEQGRSQARPRSLALPLPHQVTQPCRSPADPVCSRLQHSSSGPKHSEWQPLRHCPRASQMMAHFCSSFGEQC